jgi:hypothetical protein
MYVTAHVMTRLCGKIRASAAAAIPERILEGRRGGTACAWLVGAHSD